MKIINRTYQRNYEELEKYEAGISLTGAEVKSIREGHMQLEDAYIKILDSGPVLLNAEISAYSHANAAGYNLRQSRKLLLNKKEILRLKTKIKSTPSLTIVPISCYNKGRRIKLEIALSKGRNDLAKRKLEKARDIKIATEKEIKEYQKY
ncbi:SsrA-binding protein SmpB [Candidatus Roizmanbacteria bacterium]|nr:SsrA-binding protein SmpB [Candidatus Roizmanbacteria bacterium]